MLLDQFLNQQRPKKATVLGKLQKEYPSLAQVELTESGYLLILVRSIYTLIA